MNLRVKKQFNNNTTIKWLSAKVKGDSLSHQTAWGKDEAAAGPLCSEVGKSLCDQGVTRFL